MSVVDELANSVDIARRFASCARAKSTLRAYDTAWRGWCVWTVERHIRPIPADPSHVAVYLSLLANAGRAWSTINKTLAAIAVMHRSIGFPSPRSDAGVRNVVKGIRRTIGVAPKHAKSALMVRDVRKLAHEMPEWTIALRDKALILLGWVGAFRRSELVSLDVEDLVLQDEGYCVHIGRSKGDQEGVGRIVGIPRGGVETCPVLALQDWLTRAGISAGPLFRPVSVGGKVAATRLSAGAVARIVKRWSRFGGLDPKTMAGHSLRAGFATSAAAAGASERAIMAQTGHKSALVVRRYIRKGTIWQECAAKGLL